MLYACNCFKSFRESSNSTKKVSHEMFSVWFVIESLISPKVSSLLGVSSRNAKSSVVNSSLVTEE